MWPQSIQTEQRALIRLFVRRGVIVSVEKLAPCRPRGAVDHVRHNRNNVTFVVDMDDV